MKLYAIRGATTAESDSIDAIRDAALELIQAVVSQNALTPDEAVSLIATQTCDLRAAYSVRFIRESRILGDMPVFSAQEPDVVGALPLCIRVLLHIRKDGEFTPQHVYLRKARNLLEIKDNR
ncbi:MAG: chorismate mutase [Firmicutes bacterium]|nr:chorismate mutase [Bacillota bacterium]